MAIASSTLFWMPRAMRSGAHCHRRMGQVGPNIRHAARDVHAWQFGQGPHGRRWIGRQQCGNAALAESDAKRGITSVAKKAHRPRYSGG